MENSSDKKFNSDSNDKNKNVKASKDSKFWEYIGKILLAGVVIDGPHEFLSYRFGQDGQFYKKFAYYSLVGKYRRHKAAIGKAYRKIRDLIGCKSESIYPDKPGYFSEFEELQSELRCVPLKYKERIVNFWGFKKYEDALIISFSNEEFWDVLLSKCNDLEEQEFKKYAEEIKHNVRLVAVARFLPTKTPCLTFAVSNSDHINEINKILAGNDTLKIPFSTCSDLFELSKSDVGQFSFICYQKDN